MIKITKLLGAYLLLALLSFAGGFSAAQAAEPLKVVMLGDSLTAGYGLKNPQQGSLPSKLKSALEANGLNLSLVNAGVSGDTTAGGLARFEWSVDGEVDYLIVALGGNDVLRGLSAEAAKANLSKIILKSQAMGVKVIVLGMRSPPNLGKQLQQDFDRIFQELKQEYKVPLYDFLLEGVAGEIKYNQRDGIHPNPAGVDEMVRRLTPFLLENIKP